ncbi:MAG TPA: hypothetical protein VMX74_03475 [Pirellulales bacterium]|nr:hypothetical protein [Pirellulales bacterium]
MSTNAAAAAQTSALGKTERQDAWWLGPALTALGLGLFVVYSTFRAIYNADFEVGHGALVNPARPDHAYLLSPFYSPLLILPWLPSWISPAFFILWAPGGFRLTCYYYRKAYYRSFFLDPPACAVGEARGPSYRGETRLFLFQNLHRYFLYFALIFLVILAIDVLHACLWPTAAGGLTVGISLGTLVLAANTTLLSLYTFSCHSLRHLIGGNVDCFSCVTLGRTRQNLWSAASVLNRKHMLWAWTSLFMVGFADFYVWMVASGRFVDPRIF